MSAGAELVTARELVAQLKALGIGNWGPDAVRQWIREEPPCPVAQVGQQGQAHRYRVLDVIGWLEVRRTRERAKGWTPSVEATPAAEIPETAAGRPIAAGELQLPGISPAKREDLAGDVGEAPNARDPRNVKAHHEGRLAKLKADELEGRLIPAVELEQAIEIQAVAVRTHLLLLRPRVDESLVGVVDETTRLRVGDIVGRHIDDLLGNLAQGVDFVAPPSPPLQTEAGA